MMARIRKDINNLTPAEMDTLIKAWRILEDTPPDPDDGTDNPKTKSFFNIAGFHGEPFRGAGYDNPQWWGGYCNHGNVLFPTWHRAYLLCLENALGDAVGDKSFALPYWNQLDSEYVKNPIPKIFLQKTYRYQGTTVDIKNPLYSYSLSRAIYDRLSSFPDADYSKYKGYETVRYPFSGLVGTEDVAATDAHNSLMSKLNVLAYEASAEKARSGSDSIITDGLLQSNVSNWLRSTVINDKGVKVGGNTADLYYGSLAAPNYTVFSNTTSAQRWNDDLFDESFVGNPAGAVNAVVPLEKPHNSIHLAVGGFEVPGIKSFSYVPNANGDMGENDTAAFDPIFYFHHCFIDLVFWSWQRIHGKESKLDLLNNYPGMNSVDSQGPTPGIQGNVWLSLKTPLAPFGQTSDAVTNIIGLGYDYDNAITPPKFIPFFPPKQQVSQTAKKPLEPPLEPPQRSVSHIRISGISRADAKGSFYLSAWATDPSSGEKVLVGMEPILSRWHVNGCANCGTHLNVSTVITLPGNFDPSQNFDVLVHTRDKRLGHPSLGGKRPNIRLGNLAGK